MIYCAYFANKKIEPADIRQALQYTQQRIRSLFYAFSSLRGKYSYSVPASYFQSELVIDFTLI
jgi:hypothetical protein